MVMDSAAILSGKRSPVFATASVRQADLTESQQAGRHKDVWDTFIFGKLVEWGRNPSVLEDDDFVPPDLDVINLACDAAMQLRDMGAIPPTMVAPDGEGGTSFEYVEGKSSVSLNIYADLTVECLTFDDCRLIRREPVVS